MDIEMPYKNQAWQPLYACLVYWSITGALYLWGPVSFERANVGFVVIILVWYQTAFALGYWVGLARNIPRSSIVVASSTRSLRLVRFSIAVGFVVAATSILIYTSMETLRPDVILVELQHALADLGTTYRTSFEGHRLSGPTIWAVTALAPLSWSAFALAIAFWDRLGRHFQFISVLLFFLEASRWILLGRNKGAFDLVIIIAVVLWVRYARHKTWRSDKQHTSPRAILGLLSVGLLLYSALAYFTSAISSRTKQHTLSGARDPGPLLPLLPDYLQPTFISLTDYLAQGYHALSIAPKLEWIPTYGMGHSWFLMANFEELFGIDLFERTYQARMVSEGISSTTNWHSFYVWVANDVHWLGVIPLMAVFGYFFGRVVQMAIRDGSIASYPLLALLTIQAAYVPANAQVFQEPVTFVAFWGITLYLWANRAHVLPKSLAIGDQAQPLPCAQRTPTDEACKNSVTNRRFVSHEE